MGTDCKITLPGTVRLDDVVRVMGILSGCERSKEMLGSNGGYWCAVTGATATNSVMTECASINIQQPNGEHHYCLYFFEWSNSPGDRGMLPPSTPYWCALATRLVEFFGGKITYQDTLDGIDFKRPAPKRPGYPGDAYWNKFQDELFALDPMSFEYVEEFREIASYSTNANPMPLPVGDY